MVKRRAHIAVYHHDIPWNSITLTNEVNTTLVSLIEQAIVEYDDILRGSGKWSDFDSRSNCLVMELKPQATTYPTSFTITYDGQDITFTLHEVFRT